MLRSILLNILAYLSFGEFRAENRIYTLPTSRALRGVVTSTCGPARQVLRRAAFLQISQQMLEIKPRTFNLRQSIAFVPRNSWYLIGQRCPVDWFCKQPDSYYQTPHRISSSEDDPGEGPQLSGSGLRPGVPRSSDFDWPGLVCTR